MPRLFTVPGPRSGPDNVTATHGFAEGERYLLPGGTTVYSSLQRLFWADSWNVDFTNDGTIWNISPENVGTVLGGYNVWNIVNTGTIISEASNGNAYAIWVGSWGSFVRNTGSIYAIANGNAVAITHWAPDIPVENSGLIAAYAPSASTGGAGGVGGAAGVSLINGGFLNNLAGGAILAEGLWATAVGLGSGDTLHTGVPSIRNAGRIEAYATDPTHESVAISTGAMTHQAMIVDNSGLIRADVAYVSGSDIGWSPPQQPPDEIINRAGGQIYGRIETRLGPDRVVNDGEIHGKVMMGEGDDLLDTTNGLLDGIALMDWGRDRFLGSAGDNAVTGGRDADWLEGRAGNDLLFGGVGDDVLIGGIGNDGLYGEYGADRIVTAGGDVVDAGAGDDVIEIGDLAFASIDGGSGNDRLVLAIGADSLDIAAVRASGRVHDIEIIEMRGQQRLVLAAADVQGLSGGDDSLRLFTTASDKVELVGSWTELSAAVVDNVIFRRFALGGETALVAGNGNVTVAAAPSAPAGGLDPVASGTAAPLPGSVAGVDSSSPTTVLNNYELHATETIQSDEVWRSDNGQPLLWNHGWNYSLINYGLIESIGTGNGGAKALLVGAMDQFVNYGIMRVTGPSATGIYSDGGYSLVNYGQIDVSGDSGLVTGVQVRDGPLREIDFDNHGTIWARAGTADKAIGAQISEGNAAFNSGTIGAVGGDGTTGAYVTGERRSTKEGTITADLAAGASGSTTGLFYLPSIWGSTFVNHGLIRGTRSIDSGGGPAMPFPVITQFYNYGRLEGAIRLDSGPSRFENWGIVIGDATLGAGTNLWFGAGGQHSGAVFAGDGGDMLIGSAAADRLNGEAGDDYLLGGGGADQLSGGAGRALFVYAAASDSSAAAFDTILDFVSGTDRIDLSALGVQSASIEDGGGFTLVSAGALTLHVNGAVAQSDLILAQVAVIVGTSGADRLVATASGSSLIAGDGQDQLIGAAGNDRLDGGGMNDVMWGGAGDDIYVVDSGSDVVWEVTGQGTDAIELSVAGLLYFLPDNVENLTMVQTGFARGNELGNFMRGSSGNDLLGGGGGDDRIDGGGGEDRIEGGAGSDRLAGGAGADLFAFLQASDSVPYAARSDGNKLTPDVITDFTSGVDKISLEDIDAIDGGDRFDAFTWLGTGAFTHHAGEVRYDLADGRANIYADTNGDGLADMQIVAMTTTLTATDFIF